MHKKLLNILSIIFTCLIAILAFINYNNLPNLVVTISIVFIKNVFPFLFIMTLINNILIYLNIPYYICKVFHNKYLYVFLLSIVSGAPGNAIIIKEMLEKGFIDIKDANNLLAFTNFNNPLFIYFYLNKIFSNNIVIIKIFIIYYVLNIIIFIFYNKKQSKSYFINDSKNEKLINILPNTINKTISAMVNIYATIVLFYIISNMLIPSNTIFKGLIEITQGLIALSNLNLSLKTKELLTLVILIFGGLSIHIQVANVLNDYNIDYKNFYLAKIIMIVLSILLCLI